MTDKYNVDRQRECQFLPPAEESFTASPQDFGQLKVVA